MVVAHPRIRNNVPVNDKSGCHLTLQLQSRHEEHSVTCEDSYSNAVMYTLMTSSLWLNEWPFVVFHGLHLSLPVPFRF